MSAKKLTLAVIVFAVGFAGCQQSGVVRPLNGTPGGPIIVIRPDPELDYTETAKQTIQCGPGMEPCWYLGSFDSAHWKDLPDHITGVTEDPPRLPHYLHHNAVVYRMEVRLKSGGPPVNISNIKLALEGGELEIDVATLNTVPIWWYKKELLGNKKWPAERKDLPKVLLGKFSDVTVTVRPNQNNPGPFTKDNIEEIRIYYFQ